MIILAIDTSCDETAVAVTKGTRILSNIVWSQANMHAKWGGVMPSLAKRAHEERIDWVVERAIRLSRLGMLNSIDAVAVTVGNGLAIALEVGVRKAKELAVKLNKPLIAVNHTEGHLLSPLAQTADSKRSVAVKFPAMGVVVSGKHTDLILIKRIGEYEILAETIDDALGEALDKAARMLGLGYPGGAVLEKFAKRGNSAIYPLPLPMVRREDQACFSYSGLKTAMWRLTDELRIKNHELNKQNICDLAASFQNRAFEHLTRVVCRQVSIFIESSKYQKPIRNLLIGGGVAANAELRRRLRKTAREFKIDMLLPYSKRLYGDNAGMIGVVAGFKAKRGEFISPDKIDRIPRLKVNSEIGV